MEHRSDDPPDGGSSSFWPHLRRARDLGFLGPGPLHPHAAHALGFAVAAGEPPPELVLDLGSGGGLPGLVLLDRWPESRGVLLDSNERRTAFLTEVVVALGWGDRVTVLRARAEDVGRDPALRGAVPLVVSRGFGPPAVVAECAAPLLRVGGRLIVSEPPDGDPRWPEEPLASLGLEPAACVVLDEGRFQVLRQAAPCPERYPRRVGIPLKRPLW